MNDVIIKPQKMRGEIDFSILAPSKSLLHREMICSALAGCDMPFFPSDDICATYDVMSHMLTDKEPCFVNESASTLRFLIPLSVILGGRTFITAGNLSNRPIDTYSCMKDASIVRKGNLVMTSGRLSAGDFCVDGSVSSQFISGLLFALPLLRGDSRVIITGKMESAPYISMTVDVLSSYGIDIKSTSYGFYVPGNGRYSRLHIKKTEGDWSYAAFFVVANALGSDVELLGLNNKSLQGDRAIMSLCHSTEIDVSNTPDLFPALCVLACGRTGETVLKGAGRLRIKECDRLHAMALELSRLGAKVKESNTELVISGTGSLKGGRVFSHNDHRVLMALSIAAACICEEALYIESADCVSKSVPDFFSHLQMLGADVKILKHEACEGDVL